MFVEQRAGQSKEAPISFCSTMCYYCLLACLLSYYLFLPPALRWVSMFVPVADRGR